MEKSFKKIKKIIAAVLTTAMIMSVGMPAFAQEVTVTNNDEMSLENYMSNAYIKELMQAYEEYSTEAAMQGTFVTIPLEIFVYEYEPSVYGNIENYFNNKIADLASCPTVDSVMELSEEIRLAAESIETEMVEPYSSGGKWYYNCPELAQANAYGKYDLLGFSVTSGDIVMDEDGLFGLTGHTGIVVGHFYSSVYQTYYVRVVEAVAGGVSYGILCDQRVDERDSYVYRVSTTDSVRLNAVDWACTQIGKPYLISAGSEVNAQRANWYCSLLCYASYAAQNLYLASYSEYQILPPRTLIASSYLTMTDIGR